MYKWITAVLFALSLAACQTKNSNTAITGTGTFTLSGKLSGLGNDSVFLLNRSDKGTLYDTAVAKNDSFFFAGACPQSRIYVLQWYRKGERRRAEIFIENAAITVNGNADSAGKLSVTGSAPQKKYDEYLASVKSLDAQMDSFESAEAKLDEHKDKKLIDAIDKAYNSLDGRKKNIAKEFIAHNTSSAVASLVALRNFGTESAVVGQLDSIYQSLDTSVQKGFYGAQMHDLITSLKQTEIGMTAPEFSMNDTGGKAVSLSAFKGKVVMIDFWASWCGPCRRENPNVVRAYRRFHPKGLEILGVSLDEKRDKWLAAIAKDTLAWQHVSDLKGWSNEVAKQYAVRSIPNNYLLDKDGKIIAKTLYGDNLTEKLEEVFQ